MADNELKINRNYQTVIGDFPKVGIRPAIDGRERGVRESLESQTMNMAKAAADLISKNLRYPNGKSVDCESPIHASEGLQRQHYVQKNSENQESE